MPATTTFYEIKNSNHLRTVWLLLLFPIMIFSITFLASFVVASIGDPTPPQIAMEEVDMSDQDSINAYAWQEVLPKQSPLSYRLELALDLFLAIAPLVFIISMIWILIALFYGKKMVLAFAGAKPLKKRENPELF